MDYRTDAEIAADRQLRRAQEQSVAELLNRAIAAADRLNVPDTTGAAIGRILRNWARVPRSAPADVVDLARAVIADAPDGA